MENNTENQWLDTYYRKLGKCGISEEAINALVEKYGDIINKASFSTKTDCGLAYDGSLIETALTKLTVYAVKLNNIYPEELRVDVNSIVKVCLLQHISKAVRTEKSTNEWRIKNLGEAYTYVKKTPAIGTGLHSIAMATECGIVFTPIEIEAMTSIDRVSNDDMQFKYHSDMLSSIVYQANQMVYITAQKEAGLID